MVVKYVVDISLTDIEIKHIEYSTRAQQCSNWWGSIEKKNSQHLIFTLQLLTMVLLMENPVKKQSSCFILLLKHLQ